MATSWGTVDAWQSDTFDVKKTKTVVQTNEERPALSLPLGRVGQIVTWLIGRFRITNPNVIWYGNIQNIVETKKTEKTEVNKIFIDTFPNPLDGPYRYETVKTVTYENEVTGYTLDAAIGICLGPDVELLAIYNGEKRIWSGNASGRFEFAGDGKKKSVLKNGFIYRSGSFNQTPDPYLIPLVPAKDLPGYIGVAYIILKQVDASLFSGADLNFECRRLPNPLALAAGVNVINGNDINPATFAADVLLNEWGAVGIDPVFLDTDNMIEAAERYADEDTGMSLATAQENFGMGMLREMQDQTYSIIYADPVTSLLKIKPIRIDALAPDLYELTPQTGSSIQNMNKGTFLSMPTHFALKYFDRSKHYRSTTVINRNPGVPPGLTRARRLAAIELGAVCTTAIAENVFDLLMSRIAVPQLSISAVADRNAADLIPGDVFLMTWPLYSLEKFPVLVRKVREQDPKTNSVLIECTQYDRPNIKKYFKPAEPTQLIVPDTGAYPPVAGEIQSSPLWLLRKYGYPVVPDATISVKVDYPLFLIAPANSNQAGIDIYNEETDSIAVNYMDVCTTGQLVGSIDIMANYDTWVLPSLTLRQVVNPEALLDIGRPGVDIGERLIFINGEILSYETAVANSDGTYTLFTVHRGLLDTVADSHANNDVVYIIDTNKIFVYDAPHTERDPELEYPVIYSAVSHSQTSEDDTRYVLPDYFPQRRADMPLRPHNTTIDDERSNSPIPLAINYEPEVKWLTRSRQQQYVSLFGAEGENRDVMPTDTEHTHYVYIVDALGVTHEMGNAITGDTLGEIDHEPFERENLSFRITSDIALGLGYLYVLAAYVSYDGVDPPEIIRSAYQFERVPIQILPEGAIVEDFQFDYEVL